MRNNIIKGIVTNRRYCTAPSFNLVHEWEDYIANGLSINLLYEERWHYIFFWWRLETLHLVNVFKFLLPRLRPSLRFVMTGSIDNVAFINKNIIPIIIDFWLPDDDIPLFLKLYAQCPLMLVTSREVFEKLKGFHPQLPIEHWPLSLPDKVGFYQKDNYSKEYEFVIFGRPNPFFIRFLDEYVDKHPDFTYICNNGDINNRQYIDNNGNVIAKDTGRDSYLEMIRKTRITCYTTPGLDESKEDTNVYNQVTPRLFEMLCGGLHVIGHYPDNADTRWYDLPSIIPNVDSYTQFEKVLDDMRKNPVDTEAIKRFMKKHYTSARVEMLREILNRHEIMY